VNLPDELISSIYTKENNPIFHNENHLNKLYTIPSKDCPTVLSHGLMSQYHIQFQTFAEMSLLIRKPAIELLNYLAKTDYTKPVNKYVICILLINTNLNKYLQIYCITNYIVYNLP
jgi:hypothetical protein